jgi:MFS transporter, DHA1 family, multidrug resistance protein
VLFTPAPPQIVQDLQISRAQAEFTITVFLIGYAIGHLPYGPISNRFEKKMALYMGITLARIGAILLSLVSVFPLFWGVLLWL